MSTTARTMKRILKAMPREPAPIKVIAAVSGMHEENLRKYLRDMEDLGLVVREHRQAAVVWARASRPST